MSEEIKLPDLCTPRRIIRMCDRWPLWLRQRETELSEQILVNRELRKMVKKLAQATVTSKQKTELPEELTQILLVRHQCGCELEKVSTETANSLAIAAYKLGLAKREGKQ